MTKRADNVGQINRGMLSAYFCGHYPSDISSADDNGVVEGCTVGGSLSAFRYFSDEFFMASLNHPLNTPQRLIYSVQV